MASTGSAAKNVNYRLEGEVAVIELNRPDQLNAVNSAVVVDLVDALRAAQADSPGAIILTGAGRSFCAGHDLKAGPMDEDPAVARAGVELIQDVTRILRASNIVSIAAVHGYALGAGIEFALSCDLVVAEQETIFGFPEVAVGLSVTGGISHLLPNTVGLARAKELLLLGGRFTAQQAYDLGLINRIAPDHSHFAVAKEMALRISRLPRQSLGVAKRSLEHGASGDLASSLAAEVDNAMLTGYSGEAAAARGDFDGQGVK